MQNGTEGWDRKTQHIKKPTAQLIFPVLITMHQLDAYHEYFLTSCERMKRTMYGQDNGIAEHKTPHIGIL